MEKSAAQKNFAGVYRDEVNKFKGTVRTLLKELITTVNHADNPDYLFDNEPFPLKRGQIITSIKSLVENTGLTTKNIRTALKKLEDLKIVASSSTGVLANRARLISFISIDDYLVKALEVANPTANQSATGGQTGGKEVATNNNNNNDQEETNNELQIKEDFNEFWKMYPEKKAKAKAEALYRKVHKEHDAIMAGLRAYIGHHQFLEKKQKDNPKERVFIPFYKNPTTWLNQRCWEDEYTGEYAKEQKRIQNNIETHKFEAIEAKKKAAETIFYRFKTEYLKEKRQIDFNGFRLEHIKIMQEESENINKQFISLHPEEAKLIF